MRKVLIAAALLSAASLTSIAIAQTKPETTPEPAVAAAADTVIPDARTLASDQEVGQARRAYRAACQRHENAGFCDCVTAGVAQALMPAEVRLAARTFGERLPAQGDAADAADATSSAARIAEVEGHYANACAQFR